MRRAGSQGLQDMKCSLKLCRISTASLDRILDFFSSSSSAMEGYGKKFPTPSMGCTKLQSFSWCCCGPVSLAAAAAAVPAATLPAVPADRPALDPNVKLGTDPAALLPMDANIPDDAPPVPNPKAFAPPELAALLAPNGFKERAVPLVPNPPDAALLEVPPNPPKEGAAADAPKVDELAAEPKPPNDGVADDAPADKDEVPIPKPPELDPKAGAAPNPEALEEEPKPPKEGAAEEAPKPPNAGAAAVLLDIPNAGADEEAPKPNEGAGVEAAPKPKLAIRSKLE